jgi:hypothetical protein
VDLHKEPLTAIWAGILNSWMMRKSFRFRQYPIERNNFSAARRRRLDLLFQAEFSATARRMFAEGHTIATHSEDHPLRFGKLSTDLVEWEIDKGILDVGGALGDDPACNRSWYFSDITRSLG